MNRVTQHSATDVGSARRLVFSVAMPSGTPVYMSVKPSTYGFDDYGVVVVEAHAFLSLWRAEPHGIHAKDANGHPESWREHYKFAAAACGFLRGLSDPVPLAEVSCEAETNTTVRDLSQSYVFFSNGITRTIWLLANGCTAF